MFRIMTQTILLSFFSVSLFAQKIEFSSETRKYIRYDTLEIALKNVRVIDGTGQPARPQQIVLIKEGRITAVGDSSDVQIPENAQIIDLSGKSLLPGYIMVHEHMFYPAGQAHYNQQSVSFPRLYLAGGVTTMRTGGSVEPYTDLNIKRAIAAGQIPGPKMDVTGPYLNGPGLPILFVKALTGPEDARSMVQYWAKEGVTSFKVYQHISRAELKVVIEEAHKLGIKVTGHLCSVTYREAAELGIDNLEHGFLAATDFVQEKSPDDCPGRNDWTDSFAELPVDGPKAQSLIKYLIEKGVALTSTLPVFETFTPGRPSAPNGALNAMLPETRDQYLRSWARIANQSDSKWPTVFEKGMKLEHAFHKAGGLLIVGTDPTGYGGVVPVYANNRAIELLVEAGLSPLEAIQVATLNGAKYLEIDQETGTIEAGKTADLVVVDGDPASSIQDIRNVEIVFKDGIGYDSKKLFESAKGLVGLR